MSTKNLENRLPFELQCWLTTHFEGFGELSALPLYLKRFRGNMVYLKSCCKTNVIASYYTQNLTGSNYHLKCSIDKLLPFLFRIFDVITQQL